MASPGKIGPPNPAPILEVARAHRLPYMPRAGVNPGSQLIIPEFPNDDRVTPPPAAISL